MEVAVTLTGIPTEWLGAHVQDQERLTEGMVLALAKDTAPSDGQ